MIFFVLPNQPLRLTTLGRLELDAPDGRSLPQRRKERALLVFLARRSPRRVEREVLADLLWGEGGSDRARQSLRQALSSIRDVLGEALDSDAQGVRLTPGAIELDIAEFENHIGHDRWEAAVELWQGDFLLGLEDLGDEQWRTWLETERASLRSKLTWALKQLTEAATGRSDRAAAIRWAERWAEQAPEDEAPVAALLGLQSAAGRPAEAAARFAGFTELLAREYQRRPSAELTRLYEGLPTAGPIGGRGLLTPDLIGREEALATLMRAWDLVRGGAGRVVLIEGDEGSGRTKLSAEFARRLRQRPERSVVVLGQAFSAERTRPFATARGVVSALALAPGASATPPAMLAELAGLVPEVGERFRTLPPTGGGTTPAEAVVRLLTEVALEQPTTVIVDDAPLADPASAEALGAIARRPPNGVLVVLTGRGGAWPGAPFANDADPVGPVLDRIRLRRLVPAEIEAMLRSMGPFDPELAAGLAARLVDEAGAMPGQVHQTILHLADLGLIRPGSTGTWRAADDFDLDHLPVPGPLRTAIAEQLSALSDPARRLILAAAVLGPRIDPAVLESVTRLRPDEFRAALASGLGRRLLRYATGQSRQLEFQSEAARRTIVESVTAEERSAIERAAGPRSGSLARWAKIAAVMLVALGAVAAWRYRTTAALVLKPGTPILLTEIASVGGDSALARALSNAALIGLQQSGRFWVFPKNQLPEVLRRMGRTGPTPPVDEVLGLEIAQRENVPMVVALAVVEADSTYQLTARLIDPATGQDLRTLETSAQGRGAILGAMTQLVSQIRKALGESESVLTAARADSLPRVTTASIEALKAYTEGLWEWSRGNWVGARDWYQRAILADSTFALAYQSMADYLYYQANDMGLARQNIDRAVALRSRLTDREQLRIRVTEATIYGWSDDAIEAARVLAERWPSPTTLGSYGFALFRAGRCGESVPVYRRVLAMQPGLPTAWINLASCLKVDTATTTRAAALAASIEAYRQAGRIDTMALQRDNINHEYGTVLVHAGRLAEADSAFRMMLDNPNPLDRAQGHRSLGLLATYEGRYREGTDHFTQALAVTATTTAGASTFRNLMYLAAANRQAGRPDVAVERLNEAVAGSGPANLTPFYYAFAGLQFLKLGRVDRARAMLRAADERIIPTRTDDQVLGAFLRAGIAVAERRPEDAIRMLNEGKVLSNQSPVRLTLMAEAYASLGVIDSAISLYQRALDTRPWGSEQQEPWFEAPVRIGQLAEQKGDAGLARAAYSGFIDRLKNADADLPALVLARRRLAALQAEVRR